MTLSPNDARAIRRALADIRRKAEQAEQCPDLDSTIAALSEVWAANTRAVQLAMKVRDETRDRAFARALQEIAA